MDNPRTLTLVKPDGVCKHLTGTILERFGNAKLQLVGLKMLRLSRQKAEQFYAEHQGKPFFEPLIDFMVSAPIVAAVWQGKDAIEKVRLLMGATDSRQAAPITLRRQYGQDNRKNLVHGSDSEKSAEREIAFFFKPDEIFQYQDTDWAADNLKGKNNGKSKKTSHSLPAR
jgi:nucleoside-diphosphate kinase